MKILVNGCSHSKCGFATWWKKDKNLLHIPLREVSPSWQWNFADKLNIKDILGINTNPYPKPHKQNDYREYVEFDYIFDWDKKDSIISLATDGKGNDSIILDTLQTLRNFEQRKEKIDLVLIQFSGPSRRLVSPLDERYAFSNPYQNEEFGVNFEPSGSYLTLHYMVMLQDYLKKGGYDYFFLNYFSLDKKIQEESIFNELDLSKFITYKDNHPIFDGWLERAKKDGMCIDEDGHPSLELMEIIGSKFYEKYKSLKQII